MDIHSKYDPYCAHCGGQLVDKITDKSLLEKRFNENIENVAYAMKWKEYFQDTYNWDFHVVGVIKGYTRKNVLDCTERIRDIFNSYREEHGLDYEDEPDFYAYAPTSFDEDESQDSSNQSVKKPSIVEKIREKIERKGLVTYSWRRRC